MRVELDEFFQVIPQQNTEKNTNYLEEEVQAFMRVEIYAFLRIQKNELSILPG